MASGPIVKGRKGHYDVERPIHRKTITRVAALYKCFDPRLTDVFLPKLPAWFLFLPSHRLTLTQNPIPWHPTPLFSLLLADSSMSAANNRIEPNGPCG